ncbi:protein FAM117B-like [Gigantopelta aegis]|uniref:protein FAM117B-like n=1 Tax=Gigantopelta aegis TaxID=1735272 RepID=UPI001B88C672|nr:protein FAM117B-like [Gigantopelta aegis]
MGVQLLSPCITVTIDRSARAVGGTGGSGGGGAKLGGSTSRGGPFCFKEEVETGRGGSGGPKPAAQLPAAVPSASPLPPLLRSSTPGAAKVRPKLSTQLAVAAPPPAAPSPMETGHVKVSSAPASPPASPRIVAIAGTERDAKKRKVLVQDPSHTQPTTWQIACDKLPGRYRECVKGSSLLPPNCQAPSSPRVGDQHHLIRSGTMFQYVQKSRTFYLTSERNGVYRQGLLKSDMDNPIVHRIISLILPEDYQALLRG